MSRQTNNKPIVVLTHWVHPEVIGFLAEKCTVIANQSSESLLFPELMDRLRSAAGVMVFMPDSVNQEFLEACPDLQIVAAALKGYDNFDVNACTRKGVWFSIVPDLLTVPTAELAMGLALGVMRHFRHGDAFIRSDQFRGWRPRFYGSSLSGSTIGLYGMGALGKALAIRLSAFAPGRILYHDINPLQTDQEQNLNIAFASPEELLSSSDLIFQLTPLTTQTFHLIDANSLQMMKDGAFLVNVSRGSVVDEHAVAQALESGKLAGYAADVFEMEEWTRPDRPEKIPEKLLENPNSTLFTPHLGSAVDKVRFDIAMQAARNIIAAFEGKTPPDAINYPVLER